MPPPPDEGNSRRSVSEAPISMTTSVAAPPIWETAIALGATVPGSEWDTLPSDLAANLDEHLYRFRVRQRCRYSVTRNTGSSR
jgi:hypothetical protein